jgi:phospholipid transport system substrate-binding protein
VLGSTLAGLVAVPHRSWGLDTTPVAYPPVDQVTAPIQALDKGLVAVMRAGTRTSFHDRFHLLAPAIDGAFDLSGILRISVGLRWPDIETASKATLLKIFRRFTVASYVANFDSYDGQRFEIAPVLRTIGADRVVGTTLVPTSGDTVRIDYVMRQEGGAWRIVDVLLDGTISRVAVQRSDFRAVLEQGGAAALIANLGRKVVDMAGSSLES